MTKTIENGHYSTLIADLDVLIEQGRKAAVRSINMALVSTYWLIGRRIVEFEQKGKERAEYGEATLRRIAEDLTRKFGKGFGFSQMKMIRQFYLAYPGKSRTLSGQSVQSEKGQTLSGQLPATDRNDISVRFPLSWSHYCLLVRIDEPVKRDFYETESIRGNWSVRQLDRQIQSMLYERTALSKRKLAVIAKAHEKPIALKPEDEIKDPYILEFLGLKDEYSESELEEALIQHLEHFLLELGIGFTFIARQKRITLEGTHYRIDLLFYHRVLRCLVAIDLKIGEFTHADAGQMNLYLNYLKDKEKLLAENDPVGIILCTDKKKTVVEYALGGLDNKIFASKYKLKLPDPEVLRAEIELERRRLLEMKILKEEDKIDK
jgi:predicted nuclease of restriction endonuclease-like (RecB) superfamily